MGFNSINIFKQSFINYTFHQYWEILTMFISLVIQNMIEYAYWPILSLKNRKPFMPQQIQSVSSVIAPQETSIIIEYDNPVNTFGNESMA